MQTIDYSVSDLSDDEIREHQQRMSRAATRETQAERQRQAKMRHFRWIAGFPCG